MRLDDNNNISYNLICKKYYYLFTLKNKNKIKKQYPTEGQR